MKRLTLEDLERRQGEQRKAFVAKQEAAKKLKAEKVLVDAGKAKMERLGKFLERNELDLVGNGSGGVQVLWGDSVVGVIGGYSADSEPNP